MYEELIKALHEHAKPDGWDCGVCMCRDAQNRGFFTCTEELAAKAADAIEELQKACEEAYSKGLLEGGIAQRVEDEKWMPHWIPVTERLPECEWGAEVENIEWISCGMVHAGCFGRGGKYRDAYFRTWTNAGEGMDAKDADYWRAVTLPEPPKEET